jgi:hypothetical protein
VQAGALHFGQLVTTLPSGNWATFTLTNPQWSQKKGKLEFSRKLRLVPPTVTSSLYPHLQYAL